jgi:hypothetical protein
MLSTRPFCLLQNVQAHALYIPIPIHSPSLVPQSTPIASSMQNRLEFGYMENLLNVGIRVGFPSSHIGRDRICQHSCVPEGPIAHHTFCRCIWWLKGSWPRRFDASAPRPSPASTHTYVERASLRIRALNQLPKAIAVVFSA